ncbi:MAG: helix-turn-helix transcriptional regulator [Bacteroidota bacterium]|uniref:helix-turn-helix domain-containing protein n=1 Tax=Runella sp. TaxID=1960881 RepID=UPI003015BD37
MSNYAMILRSIRKKFNLTQEQSAEAFVISLSSIQRIEANKRELSIKELERIATYCNLSMQDVLHLGEEDTKSIASKAKEPSQNEDNLTLGKIIQQQQHHISALLEENKGLLGLLKKLLDDKESET